MSQDNENTPSLPVDPHDALLTVPAGVAQEEESKMPLAGDRLYQLAAVTAGIFFLVTLL
jgi:hypothetical protein